MASPTEAEVQAQWRNAVALLMKLWEAGRTDTDTNIISRLDTLVQSVESDFAPNIVNTGQFVRNAFAGIISQSPNLLLPHIQSYLKHIISDPNLTNIDAMLDRLYQWFIDNTLSIKSRNLTLNNPVADIGNIGNSRIIRIYNDDETLLMQNCHADAKTAICIGDTSTGSAKWEEIFEFKGSDAGIDDLDKIGSGMIKRMSAVSARDSLLLNPSFSNFAGTLTDPTDITDWTSDVEVNGTNYEISESEYFRDFAGDTTPRSLKMKVASTISQKLSLRGTVLNWDRPYVLVVAFKGELEEGTIDISIGSETEQFGVTQGWQANGVVRWPKIFSGLDTEITIKYTPGVGNGAVFVDDILLVPLDEFDGSFYKIIPDTIAVPVQFKKNDKFTWTDTQNDETGIIQYWLFRAFNRYLPHSDTPTFADPT